MVRVHESDGVALVTLGDTLISLWRDPAELSRVRWHAAKIEEMAARHGSFVFVMLLLPSSSPPTGQASVESNALTKRVGHKTRLIAVAALGDGLWIQVVRTIMRGMLLLSGDSKRLSVVATVSEALDRVGGVAGPSTPSREELDEAVEQLHVRLGVPRVKAAAAS